MLVEVVAQWVFESIVLVVVFGRIKGSGFDNLSDNGFWVFAGLIEFFDVGLCLLVLVQVVIKNSGLILGAAVGELAVFIGGIDLEKEVFEEFLIRSFGWIKG